MTQFNKTRWSTKGNTLRMGMDIAKIDKVGRTVAGWATLDNVDTEGDIVTAEASYEAFARSRMNLREMHKKDSAVGRIVSFKQDDFRAPDGNIYKGIFVKVHISKGAEDTWQKVLDKTLNGFSIGGAIVDVEEVFAKDGSTKIRKVTKYDLDELSLVDNPGNQYSDITNIFKLRKSADGSVTTLTGLVEDTKVLNVFYCDNDKIIKEVPDESYTCPVCDKAMIEIGFVEDADDREGKVKSLVTKFIGGGGEHTMTKNEKEQDESVETGNKQGDPLEVPTPAQPADEVVEVPPVEESAPVEEVPDEEEGLKKTINNFKEDIEKILEKSSARAEEKIAALEEIVKNATADFNKKASELEIKVSEIGKDLGITKGKLTALENQLEKVNSAGALRKSVDSERVPVLEQNLDPWEGSAFSVYDVIRKS